MKALGEADLKLLRQKARGSRRIFAAACVFFGAGCQGISPAPADRADHGRAPLGDWPLYAAAAYGEHGMVATNDSLATAVGVEILRDGGNAVDAAVAVAFALAVTHPEAGNLGGGGFMLLRLADGTTAALDFRETAPAAATRDMFARAGAPRTLSTHGHLASGVPGSVAGLLEALERFGSLPRTAVMRPSIALARDGFIVDPVFSRAVGSHRERIAAYAGAELLLPAGEPIRPGTRLVQQNLARTLELIARDGSRAFYTGPVAASIVAEMRRGGGIITASDLAAYRSVWRAPIQSTYRNHTIIGMPPPSSGGVAIAEALNILATFHPLPDFGSAAHTHLIAASLQRAFLDRNELIGDPDFSSLPIATLMSAAHARRLAGTIDPSRASTTRAARAAAREGNETTHFSVADGKGNVVSATTTINDHFGSGVFVREAGFFLNDEMDDFAAFPGRVNDDGIVAAEANAIAPGKRMMSSMAPTIVLDPDGRVLLAIGARGGPRIISSVLQVVVNMIDHGMTLADAMRAPRVHHVVSPDVLWHEPRGFAPAVVDSLAAMGYALRPIRTDTLPYIGRAIAVGRRGNVWEGVVDPRYAGSAAGY